MYINYKFCTIKTDNGLRTVISSNLISFNYTGPENLLVKLVAVKQAANKNAHTTKAEFGLHM